MKQQTNIKIKLKANKPKMSNCPICMEVIEGTKNIVVTECGHSFHCKCLMQNAAHNGFGCPYCRTAMAEEPLNEKEEEEDDDNSLFDYDDSPELLTDNELTSFRMFNQRLEGEDIEQEPEPDESEEDDEDDDEDDDLPDSQFITQKLTEKGFTYEDLVKCLLWGEHSDLGRNYTNYERRSSEVYGQIKTASRRFARQNERVNETEA